MTHPLEPMTPAEVETAVTVLRDSGRVGEGGRFHRVALYEPTKNGSTNGDRCLELVVHQDREVHEAVVSLTNQDVLSWKTIDGVVPKIGFLEIAASMDACRKDEGFRAALAKRGITDMAQVQIDVWPAGDFGREHEQGRRVQRCIAFHRPQWTDNGYARPIEGVMATVDVDEMAVIHLEDIGVWPMATEGANYDAAAVGQFRSDLKPVEISQPEGTSFTVDANRIEWQRWSLRVLMDDTEGLVLHDVSYDGRSVLDRASLAEMVVPYGEVRPTQAFKHALDSGEYGLGKMANSLALGCDCLGEITYLDAVYALDDGTPITINQAICIHEEDFGILWKHHDSHADTTEVRRSRRLVVSSIHTVGNYEYGIFWYFNLDGSIELEMKLTGIVTPMSVVDGDDLRFSRPLAPGLAGPIHQHLFCFRLDFAVDGQSNSVYEVNVEPLPPGESNPLGNAFRAVDRRLDSESAAQRSTDASSARYWRIVNEGVKNRLDQPVGYRLLPKSTPTIFTHPDSMVTRRAGFAKHNLWVTPYAPDERFAAGAYPTQRNADQGLPAYTAADRNIVDRDIVVWHTFGLTHDVRLEDWPVMPVERTGFTLVPDGFFDRNPALDVPPHI